MVFHSSFFFTQFHRKRDSFLVQIHIQHFYIHDIADAHHIQRMFDELLAAHLGNVYQTVLMDADIHESAEVDDVADRAF